MAARAGVSLGTAVGAGVTGAVVANNADSIAAGAAEAARWLLLGLARAGSAAPGAAASGDGGALGRQVEALAKQVERLAQQQQGGVTVVQGPAPAPKGAAVWWLAALGVAGASYSAAKGGSLWYVSRGAFRKAVGAMAEQFELSKQALAQVSQALQARVDAVAKRQEDGLKEQEQMARKLGEVGTDVDLMRGSVDLMRKEMNSLESKIDLMSERQKYGINGIRMLLHAVSAFARDRGPGGAEFPAAAQLRDLDRVLEGAGDAAPAWAAGKSGFKGLDELLLAPALFPRDPAERPEPSAD